MKKLLQHLGVTVFCLTALTTMAQERMTPAEYIEQYKDLAIREMKRMGVPAAIKLAQGILETEAGNSPLLQKSNNHFGIKCKNTWTGEGVSHDDDAPGECFRTYKDAEASYRDHSNFLRGNSRYGFLFDLDPADYKGWSYGLKKAGYATNPKYPEILIRNIEQYNLQQYSLEAVNDVPKREKGVYEDDKEIPAPPLKEEQINDQWLDNNSVVDKPDARLTVNGIKCILAPKGASLLVIATRNNINLSKLLQYNDFSEDGLLAKEQYIFLDKKSKTGSIPTCLVLPKETVHDIAQKYGIQLQYLLDYNNLTEGAILQPGSRLLLKPEGKKVTTTANTPAVAQKIHIVQAKEGLYAISKKYGISVETLKTMNNLQTDSLSIGQQLIIEK
ncbi:MAG: glucosaminidase domain-containing protein [Ferruginibacter sp.]